MEALINQIAAFSLPNILRSKFKSADRPFWCAFFSAFIALNILFIFHSAHYLFGDHDWQYVKSGIPLTAGLFEGRFTQFIFINLLTRGEILPIVNNLIGFAGYSLGLSLLARYWQLPHTKTTYTIFALFGAITPYILSFMYFAFLILPVLSWSAFIIGGLLIAEKHPSLKNTLIAAILFSLALGGYPPVINLIAVALTTRLLIALLPPSPSVAAHPLPVRHCEAHSPLFVRHCEATPSPWQSHSARAPFPSPSVEVHPLPHTAAHIVAAAAGSHCEEHSPLPIVIARSASDVAISFGTPPLPVSHCEECNAQQSNLPPQAPSSTVKTLYPLLKNTLLPLLLAIIIYKLCLIYLTQTGAINNSYYNLQTTPFSEWGNKTLLVLKDLFKQFTVTLPFISSGYKSATTALTLLAFLSLRPTLTPSSVLRIVLFVAIPLAGLSTLFISASIAETEFSPRIDFFGLNYVYMAMLALCLHSTQKWLKNLTLITALLIIILSAHNISEAQKVWKLGFDAEQSLYRRILKRYEQSPLFSLHNKYIIVQAGSPAFRPKYYHTPHTHNSDDLLNISYTPGLNAGVMWNYLSPANYAFTTSYVYTFQPDSAALEAIHTATPYPSITSTAIGANWILTILTPQALHDLRNRYPSP